jgi:chaperonin GroES
MRIEKHTAKGTRLLIKVDAVEELTKGSIVIPQNAMEREVLAVETGVIVSMGECAFSGYADGEPWANVGERITFIKHAGRPYKINGEEYRYINDVDMLGVVDYEEIGEAE